MSNVSDQRLVEILNRVSPPDIGWQAGLPTVDIHAIVLELQSLRAENERLRGLVSSSEAERVRSCSELMVRATTAEAKLEEAAKVIDAMSSTVQRLVGRGNALVRYLDTPEALEAGAATAYNAWNHEAQSALTGAVANLKGAE